jgi:endonuclease/exonuclease/phosphatase family metal-dependent hydrolase
MTYNVHSCRGMDGRISTRRLARVIGRHAPDVVALQEVDVGRARTGGEDQAHALARLLDMQHHFHPSFLVEEERYGNAILSRYPLRRVRAGALPGRRGQEPRGALWVELDVAGEAVQVINTHLGLTGRERMLQIEALLGEAWLGAEGWRTPAVLCGDLNARPRSREIRALAGRLADMTVGGGSALRSWMGLRQLDYVFAAPPLRPLGVTMPVSHLVRVASDHYPIIVDLGWEASAAEEEPSDAPAETAR